MTLPERCRDTKMVEERAFSLTAGRDLYLLEVWSSAKIISLPRVNVAHMEIATCATEIC